MMATPKTNRFARRYGPRFEDATFPFPFGGYDEVLDEILARASLQKPSRVLEIGANEGNLTGTFLEEGHDLCAIEPREAYSSTLTGRFPEVDARALGLEPDETGWFQARDAIEGRFACVVSAYFFHTLSWDQKLAIIEHTFDHWLTRRGPMLIGDLSFETRTSMEQTLDSLRTQTPHPELDAHHYWIADETKNHFVSLGYKISYAQIGPCAGVYRLTHKKR